MVLKKEFEFLDPEKELFKPEMEFLEPEMGNFDGKFLLLTPHEHRGQALIFETGNGIFQTGSRKFCTGS